MKQDERTASCYCGGLHFTLLGEPALTWLCHCTRCQQRTGSSYGITIWFLNEHVGGHSGEIRVFEHRTGQGQVVKSELCASCGTTVSWSHPSVPHARGFAGGCFADPELPSPQIELFARSRHAWVRPVAGAAQFETQMES